MLQLNPDSISQFHRARGARVETFGCATLRSFFRGLLERARLLWARKPPACKLHMLIFSCTTKVHLRDNIVCGSGIAAPAEVVLIR